MAHYNFSRDFPEGRQAEEEAKIKIKNMFPGILINENDNITEDFDISGLYESKEIKFEVKWDKMAEKTGNVAIEYESRGKKSGISVTIADFYIYKIKNKFYIFDTSVIKDELFNKMNYDRDVIGGDKGSQTKMYLIKTENFILWGKETKQ